MNRALDDYLRVLRRWWRILVVIPLLAVTATALYFIVTPPEYSAESILFVSTPRDDAQSDYAGNDYAKKRGDTFLALSRSPSIAERVINDVGLDIDGQELIGRTILAPVVDTVLLRLITTGDTPEQAEAIGYAYIDELSRSVAALESVSGGLVSRVELIPVQPPSVQGHVGMFPAWVILGAMGALGLITGAFTAVVVALLDGKIRRAQDAAEASGVPVLASFRSSVPWEKSVFLPLDGESGRSLRSTLDRLSIVGSKIIMVASAERGAGKTGVALTAARVLSDRGSAVAFVDFDSRGSRLESALSLDNQQTVVDLVCGTVTRGEHSGLLSPDPQANWHGIKVIPFGSHPEDEGSTADEPGSGAMLRTLGSTYEWVIIDTPAAIEFSEASRLARHADAIVLTAKASRTSFDELREVSDRLLLAGGHVVGVVFIDDNPLSGQLGAPVKPIQQGDHGGFSYHRCRDTA
ncbi:Wzz/FepE/Etk N-terminal domain-containing protein [Mycobacterium sp. 21AC1]|uniref:Wzz/FepE/Etk N-terminal domain-containing protein n=1 Tax=[Mycobacterium] appelbergii TaxID=2939269 RepID=UPI0029392C51|nr:Wzz/FepE/Etk N-terminal domain-containing protein [Mycobacterium sp. 21AC1]MDV3128671.1 Wzz/FepE/Etk N-terminal domain-containing protein [Mycobacterium sp. 21AC1]